MLLQRALEVRMGEVQKLLKMVLKLRTEETNFGNPEIGLRMRRVHPLS